MRTLRLAALVVRSERMRLRHRLGRVAAQVLLLLLCLGFVLAAAAFAHVALFTLLDARMPRAGALACLAGGDAVIALVLAVLAGYSRPGASEQAAAMVTREAVLEIEESLTAKRLVDATLAWLLNLRR